MPDSAPNRRNAQAPTHEATSVSPDRRALLRGIVAGAAGIGVTVAGCTDEEPRRLLALGDSYTVGTGVEEDDRWLAGLVGRLRADGIDLAEPELIAAAGWTTADLASGIRTRAPDDDHDVVTLCIGVNDVVAERPPEAFAGRFDDLLADAVSFAAGDPGSVVVATIPDYTVTPVGARVSTDETVERLETYNGIVREAAAARESRLVDLVAPSRAAADDPTLIAGDDLHPSAAQHDLWLDRFEPAVRAALDSR